MERAWSIGPQENEDDAYQRIFLKRIASLDKKELLSLLGNLEQERTGEEANREAYREVNGDVDYNRRISQIDSEILYVSLRLNELGHYDSGYDFQF